jgi:hypothetical protein
MRRRNRRLGLVAVALLLRDDGGSDSSAPAVDVSGIPQEESLLGDPDANVTLIEYADMQCPYCAEYAEQMLPTLVDDYVRPGTVNADFRVGPSSATTPEGGSLRPRRGNAEPDGSSAGALPNQG